MKHILQCASEKQKLCVLKYEIFMFSMTTKCSFLMYHYFPHTTFRDWNDLTLLQTESLFRKKELLVLVPPFSGCSGPAQIASTNHLHSATFSHFLQFCCDFSATRKSGTWYKKLSVIKIFFFRLLQLNFNLESKIFI